MKRILLLIMWLGSIELAYSQQRPQYTQYIFNNFILNPAISGIENYIDVKAGYRSQWQGLDGAPETSYISIHAPLGKNFLYGTSTSVPQSGGTNPNSRSYVQTYMASEPHHGIGFHAVSDKAGPISRTDVNATYAYHMGLSANVNLSLGVAAGVSKIYLDRSKITLENPIDQAIGTGDYDQLKPDLSAGVWLYGPRYFAGVAAQQLLASPISFSDDAAYDQGKKVPHMFISAGYKVYLGDDFAAMPSAMVKIVSPVPASVDVNMKVAYRDKFWMGASYRKDDAFSAMAGFNVGSFMNLGYSYDFTTSGLNTVSNGSHEIVLGVFLNNRYKVSCPQKSW
ncbi:PorP/SprF family type IX secretion system membrane protein [Daejeonella lutea]|uniref:Type IX secretion system membrane protein, PorP/SprF family n=1 Tax=Daejeonella lutea TaxID=572036 RepID=A0A1T5B889_9SPHI|nr:type IX secretion system membrane protein PorP/SprF [Daejeonella lutea]SKB43481.1 type IX secretion system membrane protein, PorP/SprF family [Daejeonella lutea]